MSEKANDTSAPSTSSSTALVARGAHHADEPPPPIARHAQPHLRPAAGEAAEVGRLPQHPVEPGRRNLEPAVLDALHLQHALQLPGEALAVRERHARPAAGLRRLIRDRPVDEDAQLSPVVGELHVDELVAQPDGCRFNDLADVHIPRHKQKMGARPIP